MFLLAVLVAGALLWLLAHAVLPQVFFTRRFYLAGSVSVLAFLLGYFMHVLVPVSYAVFGVFAALLVIDIVFVFAFGKRPAAARHMADRLSNGDKNAVTLVVKNNYPF